MIIAIISMLLLWSLIESIVTNRIKRPENWEDAGWMIGHLLIVPTAFTWVQPWGETESLLRTLGFFLVFEFLFYWMHRFMHAHSIPWSIHRTHHTLNVMGTLGLWRSHVLERFAFGACAVTAAWLLNPGPWGIIAVMQWSLLIQVNAHWKYGGMSWIDNLGWVSPRVHHAHHWQGARWNYGHSLIVFDIVFDTLVIPEKGNEYPYGDNDVTDTARLIMKQTKETKPHNTKTVV